jgi:D-alanine-D-alanine ligase
MTSTLNRQSLSKSTRIGVLYGGLSSEREVSLISGKNCYDALRRLGYENTVLIDVDSQVAKTLLDQKIEIAYIALHGKYGEDGCIQGLLELMGIPYTGCRVASSALTMNKALTKSVMKDAGLAVIDSIVIKAGTVNGKPIDIGLTYPVMVKPINEGSSIGMSKVNRPEDLKDALQTAFKYADEVMVEQFVKGKSITVGVVEVDGEPKVTPILELRPTKTEFYDYEAKYTEGGTEFILPAELSDKVTKAIQEATLKAHVAAGCRGMSRIDFVVDADNKFYILEINTIPGMTPLSDLPAQAKAMGIDYDELVECILKTAVN